MNDNIRTLFVQKDYYSNLYKVYGYNKTVRMVITLFADKSQDKCDDWADDFAIKNNMYYDELQNTYYKHHKDYYGRKGQVLLC